MSVKFFIVSVGHYLCIVLLLKVIGYVLPNLTICYHSGVVGFLLSFVIAFYSFGFTKSKFLSEKIRPEKRAVLITGCDTGFGHLLAKRLDSMGYHVFATCLFPTGPGATTLTESCSKRLKVLELDVTKDESVAEALECVKSNLDSCELWAVVNNAGIHAGFCVQLSSIKDFQQSFEVNSIGPVRVTKAFLPLLKKSKGRVVTVTSIAGRTIMPYMAGYFMSKHAAVAFSDCLRQEVQASGVGVISIEPELFKTSLTDPNIAREKLASTFDSLDATGINHKEGFRKLYLKKTEFFLSFASPKTELVIDDLESAITAKYPSSIYEPRRHLFARLVTWSHKIMPVSGRDLVAKIVLFIVERIL